MLIFVLSLCFVSVEAQERKRGNFDIEKLRKERAEFFVKELELTPAQAKNFIPLLNELMEKKFQVNREARRANRALMQNSSKTDADYYKAIELGLDGRIKEAEIQKEYLLKMKAVLPAEKLYKYAQVEMKFMEKTLKDHKQRAGKKKD